MYRQSEKKLVKHRSNMSSTCPHNMVSFAWPTSSWDRFDHLGHPCKFQLVSHLGSVTARHHSSSGRQLNCGVEQRAPPMFGRATITLGIGPHSSCYVIALMFCCIVENKTL